MELDVKRFLFWLQQHRRLDLLIVLLESGELAWDHAQKELRKRKTPLSDGTFRSACKGLVDLGLAEPVPIGTDTSMKYRYKLTKEGIVVASIIKRMAEDLEFLSSPEFRIMLFDPRIQKLPPDLRQVLFDDMQTALNSRIPVLQKVA